MSTANRRDGGPATASRSANLGIVRTHQFGLCRTVRAVLASVVAGSCLFVLGQAPTTIDLLSDSEHLRIDSTEINDEWGREVISCDVNGDGVEDLVIGAPGASGQGNNRFSSGEVSVIYGRRGRWAGVFSADLLQNVWILAQDGYDDLGEGLGCGDVNGDGTPDIILGAPLADGPNNLQDAAGQAHILFGDPDLDATIDLRSYPHCVIYGAAADDRCGDYAIATGDVDGSGIVDLIVPSLQSHGKHGWRFFAGRVDILFGRSSWPSSILLDTGSDTTIWGELTSDTLGGNLTTGDLDADGTDDLLVAAPGGDGLNDNRDHAGDIYVFHGRSVWPPEIDLLSTNPEMTLYGADPLDRVGSVDQLALGDLDADGTLEILAGAQAADGPDNSSDRMGELRVYEPGPSWPATVDLRTDTHWTVYGEEAEDEFGITDNAGDINGDGSEDLCIGATRGDGPNNSRYRAGEIYVFFGPLSFPGEAQIGDGNHDLTVFGANSEDYLHLEVLADLNGDGIREIVGASSVDSHDRHSSVWVISPVDIDGDGLSQLADNCPLVANADQADSDGDDLGDACEGDYDGDGQADEEDCDPADSSAGVPPEVSGMSLEGNETTLLTWQPVAFADLYDISRGLLSDLDGSDFGACQNHRDPDRSDTSFEEDETPASADGFFFLVRGKNLGCPASGSYGDGSSGTERPNSNPLACP